jgi:plasmid rolling circle replication initiator protein Rep
LLDFKLVPDAKQGGMKLKLSNAYFCRVRHCPVCQWRRSLRWKAKAAQALPLLTKEHPKLRYLFLTLTLKNCPITELRDTLDKLNYGFRKLSRRKAFPGVGWLKSVEVTQGRDRLSAHPHLHLLIAVNPSYFSHGYLSQEKWCELWQKCLKVDYKPILHVKAIKPRQSLNGILSEVIKYQVKESDLISDLGWFAELVRQLHKTRAVAVGGIFRDYFKTLEDEPEDLIGEGEEPDEIDEGHLFFGWKTQDRQYRQVDYQ